MSRVSNCCEGDDGKPPTVRSLIHDFTSPWVDQGKPVTFSAYDSGGSYRTYVVTGITTTAGGQELDFKPVEEYGR